MMLGATAADANMLPSADIVDTVAVAVVVPVSAVLPLVVAEEEVVVVVVDVVVATGFARVTDPGLRLGGGGG
jgi:hypothetical protein